MHVTVELLGTNVDSYERPEGFPYSRSRKFVEQALGKNSPDFKVGAFHLQLVSLCSSLLPLPPSEARQKAASTAKGLLDLPVCLKSPAKPTYPQSGSQFPV